jgi:hypothetical protein
MRPFRIKQQKWVSEMKQRWTKFAATLAFAALSIAPVQATCWSSAAADAARVRDMETMLMVSALRCKMTGKDVLSAYNLFVRTSRTALTEVNDSLRLHFTTSGGLNAYDRYVTSIANRYGAGADGLNCNDIASILSAANAEGGSKAGLVRLSRDADVRPVLQGGLCAREIAAIK